MTHPISALRHKGFTLIETLIYIALFGVILSGVMVSAYPLITGTERLSKRVVAESESAFVLHKINWALYSKPISPIYGISGGSTLKINFSDVSFITFSESAGAITMNGTSLTASRVTFSGFTATVTNPSPGLHVVKVDFIADGEPFSQTYNVFY